MAFPTALTNAVDGTTEIVAAHLNNLETKVGIDSSADTDSLDYRVATLESIEIVEVDYGATSTLVGWSIVSLSFQNIGVKKIGKTVFIKFLISGTSNDITTSFTLPYSASGVPGYFIFRAIDNTSSATAGYGVMSSSTATLYTTPGLAGWTGSGTKTVSGQFFYETS